MTTKSSFIECNRATARGNIFDTDNYRWRTTLKEPLHIKKGDQVRVNMAVLGLLGTGDYIEITDNDLNGEEAIYNNNGDQKSGTGMAISYYMVNSEEGYDLWFRYGANNQPQPIAGTYPATSHDYLEYFAYQHGTRTIELNNTHHTYSNNAYGVDDVIYHPQNGEHVTTEHGHLRTKWRWFMDCDPSDMIPNSGDYRVGMVTNPSDTFYKYVFGFQPNGDFWINCDGNRFYNSSDYGKKWKKGNGFKIARRMYGIHFKMIDEYYEEDLGGTDSFYNLNTYDYRPVKGEGEYDEWSEPRLYFKAINTNPTTLSICKARHVRFQKWYEEDHIRENCYYGNPKIIHKRDDDGNFIDKDGNTLPHDKELLDVENLGDIQSNRISKNFLFEYYGNTGTFNWLESGFYSESDLASRITEQMVFVDWGNSAMNVPTRGGYQYFVQGGINPSGSQGLIVNNMFWSYNDATANDSSEYQFVKFAGNPLPAYGSLTIIFFMGGGSADDGYLSSCVGADAPTLLYDDETSRFQFQYLHTSYKEMKGTSAGKDTAVISYNTGTWTPVSANKVITRQFKTKFAGVEINELINKEFWSKLGFTDGKIIGGGSTDADVNLSYNTSQAKKGSDNIGQLQRLYTPTHHNPIPDASDSASGVRFCEAKSSFITAITLPLKVNFPYFLMLTSLPINGVGNKYYAFDGQLYNCLGHIARNYSALDFIYQLDGNTFTVDNDAIITYIDIDIRLPNMNTPPNINSSSSIILEFIQSISPPITNQTYLIQDSDSEDDNNSDDNRKRNRQDKRLDNRKYK